MVFVKHVRKLSQHRQRKLVGQTSGETATYIIVGKLVALRGSDTTGDFQNENAPLQVEQEEGERVLVGQREVGDGAVQRLQVGSAVRVRGLGGAHELVPRRRGDQRLLQLLQELLHAAGNREHVLHQTLGDE